MKIWQVGCRREEGETNIVEVFEKVGKSVVAGEATSPAVSAAMLAASIPSSETIRRSPPSSTEQQAIKRVAPEHCHSRPRGRRGWVLCCALWLLEYKSHMNCAAAAGFTESKEDYVM